MRATPLMSPLPPARGAPAPAHAPGTIVSSLERDRARAKGRKGRELEVSVKGFATIDNVSLINIEGTGMVGVPGARAAAAAVDERGRHGHAQGRGCAAAGLQRGATRHTLEWVNRVLRRPMLCASNESNRCQRRPLLPPNDTPTCTPPPPPPPCPGIASAVFSTVRDAGVNVIMISQASSEHSICFAVKSVEAPTAGACASLSGGMGSLARARARARARALQLYCSVQARPPLGRISAGRRGAAAAKAASLLLRPKPAAAVPLPPRAPAARPPNAPSYDPPPLPFRVRTQIRF
jgi:hypothetical protein